MRPDGSPAETGEPLVRTRFDLNRLAWLTSRGPSADQAGGDPRGTAENIRKFFGLVWDGRPVSLDRATGDETGHQWVYTSPSAAHGGGDFNGNSGSSARVIKTLDVVADEGREPDFFELLQAGILGGSLALCSQGEIERSATNIGDNYAVSALRDGDDQVVNAESKYHIARLAANILDQFDADSFPSVIRLNDELCYGGESLPYLSALGSQVYRLPETGSFEDNPYRARGSFWMEFGFWNPNQNAQFAPGPEAPSAVRIFPTRGRMNPHWFGNSHQPRTLEHLRDFEQEDCWVAFTDAAGRFFNPTLLSPAFVLEHQDSTYPGASLPQNARSLAGIYLGRQYAPDWKLSESTPPIPPATLTLYQTTPEPSTNVDPYWYHPNNPNLNATGAGVPLLVPSDWRCQFQNAFGEWQTYQVHWNSVTTRMSTLNRADSQSYTATNFVTPATYGNPDPRSVRLGLTLNHQRYETTPPALAVITDPPNYPSMNRTFRSMDLTGSQNNGRGSSANRYRGGNFSPEASAVVHPQFYSDNTSFGGSGGLYSGYTDNDGVQRPGDAAGFGAYPLARMPYSGNANMVRARPLILNRPFANVAEFGYVFRDLPWKTFDFFSDVSADGALLDLFFLGDGSAAAPPVMAGKVNLGTIRPAVLQALLTGKEKNFDLNDLSAPADLLTPLEAATIATNFTSHPAGPPLSLADLPSRLGANAVPSALKMFKQEREAAVRAVSGIGSARTWNLMIDLVVQSGRFPANATNLNDFVVQGERHYWIHLAIDRYTGAVVDRLTETVQE